MDQASKLRSLLANSAQRPNTHAIAITSGKGGVGKSAISANLANILAKNGYKIVLFDADIGLANLDVLLNVRANKNLLNVMRGECEFSDIIVEVKQNLYLVPGESGADIFKFNDNYLFDKFINDAQILNKADFLVIDTGAGIGPSTQTFLGASDEIIVVTTPDPAAITDAYAVLKTSCADKKRVFMIVNFAKNEDEALKIFNTIQNVAKRNIQSLELEFLGYILRDNTITKSIKNRALFSDEAPDAQPCIGLKSIADGLLAAMEQKVLKGINGKSFTGFFKQLANGS